MFTRFGPGLGQDFGQVFGEDLGQYFGQTEQQKQQHSLQQQRGARVKRARPFAGSVPAVVFGILFDQDLDQKLTWAGLGQALGWPRSSPGLGSGQALGKIAPIFPKASPNSP